MYVRFVADIGDRVDWLDRRRSRQRVCRIRKVRCCVTGRRWADCGNGRCRFRRDRRDDYAAQRDRDRCDKRDGRQEERTFSQFQDNLFADEAAEFRKRRRLPVATELPPGAPTLRKAPAIWAVRLASAFVSLRNLVILRRSITVLQ
jgi:hypothetical protein